MSTTIHRHDISDEIWSVLEPHLPGQKGQWGRVSAEERLLLDKLDDDYTQVESDYAAMKTLLERPAPDIQAKRSELEGLILQKKNLIAAIADYLFAKNNLMFKSLPLKKVGFSLYDIIKTTGEIKNVFRVTYDGREYRKLSHSEKVFAGMEICEMFKELTGRYYPVFVDDSESVVQLQGRPKGQIFLSRVMGGSPLTVTLQNYSSPQELKKAS